ncbi:MAG TPA: chorismate mutase [Methanocella sp.]|nr:chorismate mutase [Methanocella sp.]
MTLDKVREEISRVDDEMLRLIARRMQLAGAVLDEKRKSGVPISDDRQNGLVLKRAMERATELNVDPAGVREIFTVLIRMSIDRQHEMAGEGNLP